MKKMYDMEEFLSKNGSVTILLFCFLLTLNILFPTFWAFGRVTMNIQGKKKKASGRDRTDAKKRP